jgi:hypothetical protein
MKDQALALRPPLRREDPTHGRLIQPISAQPVDGFGWERYQTAANDDRGPFLNDGQVWTVC